MLQNLLDIYAAPTAVFERLKTRPSWFLPLLLVIVAIASIQIGYVMTTDYGYLVDQLVEQSLARNPNARASEVRAAMENLNPSLIAISASTATAVAVVVLTCLYAGYLSFLAKFSVQELGYRHWLAMGAWANMPTLLVALAAWVVMLSSINGQVPQAALQPLSLHSLLNLDGNNSLLQNLSLPQFWSMALLVIGYRCFTDTSWTRSAIATLAPYAVIYGIWALFVFL